MLELVFQADCLEEMIGGVNEAVAMLLEQWGDVRLIFGAEPDFYKYDPKRG